MANWGGIVAAGLVGGAIGAGTALKEDALEREKIAAQKQRDEYLSALRVKEHGETSKMDQDLKLAGIGPEADAKSAAALRNLPSSTQVEEGMVGAREKGKITAEGGVRVNAGQSIVDPVTKEVIMTGPKAEEDPEIKAAKIEELRARAAAERDRASAYREGMEKKGGPKDEKIEPKWVAIDKGDPSQGERDAVTGITRVPVAAVAAKEGKSHWFGKDEPAVSAKGPGVQYYAPDSTPLTQEDFNKVYEKATTKRNMSSISTEPSADVSPGKAATKSGGIFFVFDRRDSSDFYPYRCIKLQSISASCCLWIAKHNADFHTNLIDKNDNTICF